MSCLNPKILDSNIILTRKEGTIGHVVIFYLPSDKVNDIFYLPRYLPT